MDLIQSKLNVIEWMTDYKGHVYDTPRGKVVELTHKRGFNCTMYSAKTVCTLLPKLDRFLYSKVKF